MTSTHIIFDSVEKEIEFLKLNIYSEHEEIKALKLNIQAEELRINILLKNPIVPKKSIRCIKKERFLRKLEIISLFKTILGANTDFLSRDHATNILFEIFGGFVSEFFKYNYYDDREFLKEHDTDLDMCIYKKNFSIDICLEVIKRIQDVNPMIIFRDITIVKAIPDGEDSHNELTHVKCNCHYNGEVFKMDIFDNSINEIRSTFNIPYDYDINNIYLNVNKNIIVFGNNIIGTMINIVNKEAINKMPFTVKLWNNNINRTFKMIERQVKLKLLGYKPDVNIISVDFDTETECGICKSPCKPSEMKPFKSCPCNEGKNICMTCFIRCGLTKCPICKTDVKIYFSRDKSTELFKHWIEIPEATYSGDNYIDGNITVSSVQYTERNRNRERTMELNLDTTYTGHDILSDDDVD
jgi:hypothetical protein